MIFSNSTPGINSRISSSSPRNGTSFWLFVTGQSTSAGPAEITSSALSRPKQNSRTLTSTLPRFWLEGRGAARRGGRGGAFGGHPCRISRCVALSLLSAPPRRSPAKADARAPRPPAPAPPAAQRKPWQPQAPGRAPPGASSTDRCYVVRQTGEAFKTYACVDRHRLKPPDPEPTQLVAGGAEQQSGRGGCAGGSGQRRGSAGD